MLLPVQAFKLDFNIGLGTLMTQSLTDPNKLLKESAVDFADMVSIVVCPQRRACQLNC